MTKKTTRNITLAITSALLIYASTQINLPSKEENLQTVSEPSVTLSTPETERTVTVPLEIVFEEEHLTEFSGDKQEEFLPLLPKENEPVPTTPSQQATTLTEKQADTREVLPTVTLTETTSENQITPEEVCEPTINIPDAGTMNGIDYGTSQTIQPDVTKPTYTQEQLTDPSQKPDGTPVDSPTLTQTYDQTATPTTVQADDVYWQIQNGTYEFNGDEIIYTDRSIIYITFPPENQEPVYVPGFGWVEPSNEPNIRVQLLDMYESGVKVGTMGGG